MIDYGKLTVVKLREELVSRSLPKTGLKAELVKRLIDDDARKIGVEEQAKAPPAEEAVNEDVPKPVDDEVEDVGQEKGIQGDHAVPAPTQTTPEQDPCSAPSGAPSGIEQQNAILSNENATSEPGLPAPEPMAMDPPPSELPISNGASPMHNQSPAARSVKVTPEFPEPPALSLERQETQHSVDPPLISTQLSMTGEELREETNKRKRRSQSPPPSSAEVWQKRARTSGNDVEFPEDLQGPNLAKQIAGKDEDDVMFEGPPGQDVTEGKVNGQAEAEEPDNAQAEGKEGAGDSAHTGPQSSSPSRHSLSPTSHPRDTEIVSKPSPEPTPALPSKSAARDIQFKGLFNPNAAEAATDTQTLPPDDLEERTVPPALHPATRALYIRDLMRPLQPPTLKKYLISLASPAGTSPDPDIIQTFFLDSIRTHCLVVFSSISAASRVRSALHERPWPDEKDRKPLWVDYAPEEKIQKWIDVEGGDGRARPSMSKRWEVIYEDEDGEIKAYLQEADPNAGPPKGVLKAARSGLSAPRKPSAPPTDANGGNRKEVAPAYDKQRTAPAANAPTETSFRALESLFRSTTAKPKLYYLPAPQATADERLKVLEDEAHDRRGARRDDVEHHRCSFDSRNRLLDKGVERGRFGRGRGGPPRGGGGYRGGGAYSGGGGRNWYRGEEEYGRGRRYEDDGGYERRRGGYRDDGYRR